MQKGAAQMKSIRLAALVLSIASVFSFNLAKADDDMRVEREEEEGRPKNAREAHDHALRRAQAFWDMYADEFGVVDPELKLRAAWMNQVEWEAQQADRSNGRNALAIGGTAWSNLGPTNFAGRVSMLAVDPNNAAIIYRGTAGGGVWKSTDTGSTWTVLTDGLGDLSIGAVAVAPSNSSIVYVGTGEGALGSDGINGIGFLKSTDAGATWGLPVSVSATKYFDLSVHPTNANEILAANTLGIQKSTDGGATWVTKFSTYSGTALARVPGTPATILATVWDIASATPTWKGWVYRSTDSGETWTKVAGDTAPFSTTDNGRMSLAIAPSAPTTIFAMSASAAGDISGCADDPVDQRGIYRSTDGGTTWALRSNPYSGACGSHSSILAGQGWYATTIKVDPANALNVYAGGLDIWKSTDGGGTFSKKSSWSASPSASNYCHADIHSMVFTGTTLLIGDDGGVNRTADGAATFSNLNTNVVTRQYYSIALSGANPNFIIGGAQDNGTNLRSTSTTSYSEVIGGDGFGVAAHPTLTTTMYGTVYSTRIFRSTDSGSSWPEIGPSYGSENAPFITPLTMDPNTPATLYTGTQYLWRSTNSGTTWAKPSTTDLGDAGQRGYVTKIAVARSNSQHLLAGTGNGYVRRSTNGGTSWSAPLAGGLPTKYVAHVEFDPTNTNIFYVSYAGGTTGGRLFRTADGGTTFTQIDAGLPNFPVHVIRVDPTDAAALYAGSDLGLYRSTDSGATWARWGTGLPAVSIWDIGILPDGSVVRAATHGRGFWELAVSAPVTYSISGNAGTSGATLTAGTKSATSDGSSNYTITGLSAGTYTVTPSKSGCTFSPTSLSVTVGPDATGKSFTATCAPGPLFSDGFESGGWSSAQVSGTAGAWSALTAGVHPVVSPHGGSTLASFNSYTSAAGNQTRYYRATGFAVPASSTVTLTFWMYHETGYTTSLDKVQAQVSTNGGSTWTNAGSAVNRYDGTTGWKLATVDLSAYAGTTVNLGFLGISAYGNDEYIDDVTVTATAATSYSISGNAGTSGATVTAGAASTTSDGSSNFSFAGLSAGTYTVTPSKSGCTFSPTSQSVTVGPNASGVNFTASCTYSISGNAGTTGATVTAGAASTTSDGSSNYTLSGLAAGTYTVTPSKSGCTFSPTSQSVTVGPNATGKNFTASCPAPTYSIAGNAGTSGATVSSGAASATSDASSNYTISGLAAGTYTVTPSKTGCTFSPTSQSVTVGPNATGKNFTATCGGPPTLFSDGFELSPSGWSAAQVSGTAGAWSIATSGTHPVMSVHGGTKMGLFNSYTSASGNQTRMYRATGFAIAGTYTTATLTFWMYHDTGYSTAADRVQVQVSTNGGTSWTSVGTAVNRYDGTTGWKQHTIDLSAYKGTTVNLGFLGISVYGNDVHVDDVSVSAQ